MNPFLAEFLSTHLSLFIELSIYRSRRWTKTRVADHISGSGTIPGTVSDTTIGRLLDPAAKQEPSGATLEAVAAFLIEMQAVTPKQIELASHSPSLVEATSFASVFPRPRTEAYAKFLNQVAGRYSAIEARGAELLSSEIVARLVPEAGVLVVQEVLAAFHVDDLDLLKRQTRNLAPESALDIRPKLRAAGGREIGSTTLSGFMIATSDLMAMMLRAGPGAFHSIIDVREIDFDEDERVLGLDVRRNMGWTPAGTVKNFAEQQSFRSVVRKMAGRMTYKKFKLDKYSPKIVKRKPANKKMNAAQHDFISTVPSAYKGGAISAVQSKSDRLIVSINHNDLDAFKVALNDGAEPNALYPGSAEPIVFVLAADGKIEFVEALLATGRCDLTRASAAGMPASYAPGVTSRFFAPTGPTELVERFRRIALMLREEEARQLSKKPAPTLDL